MFSGPFVTGIDLVDISLWLFTLFFLGLIFYLRLEDRREGYPLETDTTNKLEATGVFWSPKSKRFNLPHGRGELDVQFGPRDTRELALKRMAVWPGSPYEPTGDPMQDGVGPASYAMREDVPDLTLEGEPRISPFRDCPAYTVAKQDRDPRGLTIYGTDKQAAGTIVDIWVDRSEAIVRYLEVEVPAIDSEAPKRLLVPMFFANVSGGRNAKVVVEAVTGAQLQAAPIPKVGNVITRREEDRIMGYFGGGTLYANAGRSEPIL